MAYKLQLKRGASGSLPTGSAGEPLFTTDTNDLYIGTGGANQRFQKYIASGTSAQFLKGDGSLDSNTYYLASNPSAYIALTALTASAPLSYNNTTGAFTISQASGSTNGYLSSTDWTTFNNKQNALTNPVTGTGTTNYLPKWTSGSALGNSLVFDNGTNVGIGTATPSTRFQVVQTLSYDGIRIVSSNATTQNTLQLHHDNDKAVIETTYLGSGSFKPLCFNTQGGNVLINSVVDNGNRLQVTGNGYFSGNVGIGTATPTFKLQVYDAAGTSMVVGAATGKTYVYGDDAGGTIGTISAIPLRFSTNSVERARIDSSGNLGLGVVPSAWASDWNVFQIGSISSLSQYNNNNSLLLSNNYYNSTIAGVGAKYIANGTAGVYQISGNNHYWYNAPSGTSGSAITLTQAMTLTASGRLLLGTTTEGTYLLDVNGTGRFSSSVTAGTPYVSFDSFNARGKIFLDDSTRRYVTLGMDSNVATINCDWYSGAGGASPDFAIKTNATERIRITSGGNLLVGTSVDSGERLQVSGSAKVSDATPILTINGTTTSIPFGVEFRASGLDGYIKHTPLTGLLNIASGRSVGWGGFITFTTDTVERMRIKSDGIINLSNVPSSATGLSSGDIYKDASGFLKIV